jgi:hypothetical protein
MLNKLAASLGQPDEDDSQFGHTMLQQFANDFRPRKENFATITLRDKFGREAVTTPYHMRQTFFADEGRNRMFSKPAIAATLALGALGAVIVEPQLLRKALALLAMGIPAAAIINLYNKDRTFQHGVVTSEGDVLSDQMAAGVFKMSKTARLMNFNQPRLGTLAGMAVPGALALDYAYNRWKYGPYGNPEGDSVLTNLGEFVAEHPAVTGLAGAMIGSQSGRIGRGIAGLLKRKAKT